MSLGIGAHARLVYQFGVLGYAPSILGIVLRYGQSVRGAVGALPCHAVIERTRIAQVVIGFHKPRFTPHPRQVYRARRVDIELPIGVTFILAVDKHILHAMPLAALQVIAVHDQVATAR